MKYLLFAFSLLFTLLFRQVAYASKMHVLLAIGTSASPQVQKAIDLDLKYMKEALLEVKNKLHLDINIKELSGQMLTDSGIHEWIKTLPLSPDDLAFLFYAGGAITVYSSDTDEPTDNSRQRWPSCDLAGNDEIVDLEIYIDELYETKCRFRLLMADCCTFTNSSSKSRKLHASHLMAGKALNPENKGYETLFLESNGMIATSAQVMNTHAWVSSKGSLFTETFLTYLKNEVQLPNPDWNHLFEKTFEAYDKLQQNKYQYSLQEVEYKSRGH
jgi:hypothetical protein